MARVYTQKTRVERTCGRCGRKIEKGEKYYSFSPGFRSRPQVRCIEHYPRGSELTTSKMSEVYAAVEDAEDSIRELGLEQFETLTEDIETIFSQAADLIRDVAEEYREASAAWAGGERPNEEWEEKAELIESGADELGDWQPESEFDDEDLKSDELDEARETWVEDVKDGAIDYLHGVSYE